MTRFEKAERKGPSRGPGRVQAICVVSDLKTGAIAVYGMIDIGRSELWIDTDS
jgi:hypothetical protein